MVYGYARVSTKGQARDGNGLEAQQEALASAGANTVYCEAYTGTKKHRPELDKLLSKLRSGDTLIVTKLDRIARNTRDGIEIIDAIVNRGCALRILNMGMFDDTPTGKLMRTVLLAFAEFERDMIVQRTSEGKAIARLVEGYREGRPELEIPDFKNFFEKQKAGLATVGECCTALGISRSTWYARVRTME